MATAAKDPLAKQVDFVKGKLAARRAAEKAAGTGQPMPMKDLAAAVDLDFGTIMPKAVDAMAIFDTLGDLVQRVREVNKQVADAQAVLDAAQAELNDLTLRQIPDAMDVAGLEEFKLKDGAVLSVKQDYKVAITRENAAAAYAWLHASGHGQGIKESFVIDTRVLTEPSKAVLRKLLATKFEITPEVEMGIHNGTLKALVREMIENGQVVDKSISVHEFKIAKVKEKK